MTMNSDELLAQADIAKIAEEGKKIYEAKKAEYEPESIGKFLAIDVHSEDVYLADTSADAVAEARKAHPDTVFYVVRIGFESAEAMAHSFLGQTY